MKNLVENIDYYVEDGRVVFTEQYHLNRGYCCGNKCRHCPFHPKHIKQNPKKPPNSL